MFARILVALAPVLAVSPAMAQSAPNPARGKVLFMQCASCHSTTKGAPHKVGPNLAGIAGAQAGTRAGYNYSQAVRQSKVRWDDAQLARFVEKPNTVVPGTKMVFPGMSDPAKRRDLVAYIKTLR